MEKLLLTLFSISTIGLLIFLAFIFLSTQKSFLIKLIMII